MRWRRMIGLALLGVAVAQKRFEGTIVYQMKLEGAAAAQLESYIRSQNPDRMTIYYRGNKSRTDMGERSVILDLDSQRVILIQHNLKTFTVSPLPKADTVTQKPKITKTEEKSKILGYVVEKYIAELPTPLGSFPIEIWVAPDLVVAPDLTRRSSITRGAGVPGLPLRIVSEFPGMEVRMVMTSTKIIEGPPEASLFRVPEGYNEDLSPQLDLGR
ncbi:MAG: DUF4412 domain-containing protein [Bacteroidia bacterium]